MGSLGFWRLAQQDPTWIAAVDPDGTEHTAGEILARSNQLVHGLRALGLKRGDGITAVLPNHSTALTVYLAAMQAGWYYTPINWHFTAPEIAYIVADSDARAFFVHERFAGDGAKAAKEAGVPLRISFGEVPGFTPVEEVTAGQPDTLPEDRTQGTAMHYTSGTTGRPKGVRRPLTGIDPDDGGELMSVLLSFFGITPGRPNAHLVTSPNYHTAVTQFGGTALQMGHTLVYMDRWDAEEALRAIERYRVTNTHMVPTHFKRLLSLPEEVRNAYDVSSMRWAIHAAAPCPVPVKRQMLEWWGPCIYEYYAATEGGGTIASPEDWLAHPGTVGKPWPVSEVVVVDDDGAPCPVGTPGTIYMRMPGLGFEYKDDPAKTQANRLKLGPDGEGGGDDGGDAGAGTGEAGDHFTVGDIGYFDEDGFLYLCDRKSDMIISGGVNIYPAEIEAEIIVYPKVADVAVFGVPDEEWGEQIKAVVEPAAGVAPGPELTREILGSLDGKLAKLKWPRSIDYIEHMPRDPSGKLLKRKLRDPYWKDRERAI